LFAFALAAACAGARAGHRDDDARGPVGHGVDHVVLADLDGREVRLASLRGRVVLVTFFATWCLPCLAEVPTLRALRRTYGPRGFEVVGVSFDLDPQEVLPVFMRALEVDYPVLLVDREVVEGRSPFGPVPALPATFLVDRAGTIVGAWEGLLPAPRLAEEVRRVVEAAP
jgi:peroxiredoxin